MIEEPEKSFSFDCLPDLPILEATLQGKKKQSNMKLFCDSSKANIVFTENLTPGMYPIVFSFKGKVRNDQFGIYRCSAPSSASSKSKTSSSAVQPLIATHFEPNFSCLAFPCIVDYSVRSQFTLKISIPSTIKDIQVISNTNCENVTVDGQFKHFEFAETPPIASYLVGFTIGVFSIESIVYTSMLTKRSLDSSYGEEEGPKSFKISIVMPISHYDPNQIKNVTKQLLSATNSSILAMETFFELPFPFEKLDIVCIPDLVFAGMENLNLCFLHLIPNSKDDPNTYLFSLQSDLLHEICHHWIGNYLGLSIRAKEGVVQFLERHFAEKLFTKTNSKAPNKKKQATFSITKANNSQAASLSEVLWKNFSSFFNEDFYINSLKQYEQVASQCGMNKFRANLSRVVTECEGKLYLEDDEFISKLTSQ